MVVRRRKKMKRVYVRRISLVLALIALLTSTILTGCAKKVTGDTPRAQSALTADAIVIRVNELQATVIQICGPQPVCAPEISTPLARDIVQTCIDLRTTLKAVPQGWLATIRQAWIQARPRFSAVTNVAVQAALSAVDALIGGLQ